MAPEDPIGGRHLAANGIRFRVVTGERFAPGRPLVLLLHGFLQHSYAWRHQLPALDAAGYSVAALDLRGYGGSDKTPRGYDPRTTGTDIGAVVRSLGFAEGIVIGHDWGGMAGWYALAYASSQVRALITVAAPDPSNFPWRRDLRSLVYHQLPIVPERRIVADGGRYVEEFLRARAADPSFLTAEDARHYRDALMWWPSPHCALEYRRMFVRGQLRTGNRDLRDALGAVRGVPVVRIQGADDPVLPRVHPGPDVDVVPHAGHYPHEERPAETTAALVRSLARLT